MNRTLTSITLWMLVLTFSGCEQSDRSRMELAEIASENVSHLLVKPASTAGDYNPEAPRNYLPDPHVDWVVTYEFKDDVPQSDIIKTLSSDWLEEYGQPIVYGLSSDENRWTFVNAIDAPARFQSLKIAWSLWDSLNRSPKTITSSEYLQFKTEVQRNLAPLGVLRVIVESDIEELLAEIAALPALVAVCDKRVTLRLVSSNGKRFRGRDVWDVMLCLGLNYGDGDLFHWINNSGFGNDLYFTVETSTPPGYFIPRRLASNEGDVEDLIFSFSIPRSADPVAVFDSMTRAVEYVQSRLGGKIILENDGVFHQLEERQRIQNLVELLNKAGFIPGESATCRVF